MARVRNWQINREMSYWYPESRPKRQFAAVFDTNKCIACYPKFEIGEQQQCFVNCIGKIRMAGTVSLPGQARADNPIDYLVHIRKLALPLFPQFGLEPNVYYVPPIHVPRPFLRQMFGPGVEQAIETYRGAADDPDLAGLLSLFGSTARVVPRWQRHGDVVVGFDEDGGEIVRVPLHEPVFIRQAFDAAHGVVRTNVPVAIWRATGPTRG
jgi:nitrate reductase beta subunit